MFGSCGINGVATLDCVFPLISTIITWSLSFGGVVALIIIIWGGIMFLTSGGDPKKLDSSRKIIIYAVFGLILIFLAFAIVDTISYLTGVSCINTNKILSFGTC